MQVFSIRKLNSKLIVVFVLYYLFRTSYILTQHNLKLDGVRRLSGNRILKDGGSIPNFSVCVKVSLGKILNLELLLSE